MWNTLKSQLSFGEKVEGYEVKVINEREARAAAGIFLTFALIAFLKVRFVGDFSLIKVFVIAFFIDFFIRIFINPKFAPSMILGRLATMRQNVEYVGAPQKKFAWGIGLFLATIMLLVMVLDIFGNANDLLIPICLVCILCLIMLFFEAAFGICIGCAIYNLFHKDKAKYCPGGVCEIRKKEAIQRVTIVHGIILVAFIILAIFLMVIASGNAVPSQATGDAWQESEGDCLVNPSEDGDGSTNGGQQAHPCLIEKLIQ